ncbi:MAG: hypothetical protein IT302_13370 [Dehalococcoidia bacterium]|nr:hypothetical protein [Dehalococcoidia bacterium]
MDAALADWLLEGDPAVRWQVQRDLLDASPATWEAERARIGGEGWGATVFANQQPGGRWGSDPASKSRYSGLYSPKWTSTTFSLLLLARMGLPPGDERALAGCRALAENGNWLPDGGLVLWAERPRAHAEACVVSMLLRIFEANGYREGGAPGELTRFLLEQQFADGGWNCRLEDHHSSFNTTLLALEGLAALEPSPIVGEAMARGREFLLAHRLFRSHTTGAVVAERFTHFTDPIGWQYTILRALDHFATTAAPWDERAADAIAIVEERRGPDGRWRAATPPAGPRHVNFHAPREASRWVTLRCLRALRWWNARPSA